MAGDISKHPNFAKRLQDKIMSLKMQGKIQLFGSEMDMRGLYGLADVVLSTSIEPEAFGRVVVEAQAMERLVIATNIGGAAETVEDGKTGYHVLPNNPEDLAAKISHALSILGTKEAEKVGKAARASAIKNFSLETMLKKTLAVYEELL
jgi:glycosyltransferase involved in cell wall biosynthesis